LSFAVGGLPPLDEAAAEYANTLAEWDQVTSRQEAALHRAGAHSRTARPAPWMLEDALGYHLRAAQVPHGAIRMVSLIGENHISPTRWAPLVKVDAKPVEPDEETAEMIDPVLVYKRDVVRWHAAPTGASSGQCGSWPPRPRPAKLAMSWIGCGTRPPRASRSAMSCGTLTGHSCHWTIPG
jgi:hypothetical protein